MYSTYISFHLKLSTFTKEKTEDGKDDISKVVTDLAKQNMDMFMENLIGKQSKNNVMQL